MGERRKTAADIAADTLRGRILGGTLSPDDVLPGERDLAEQLGVSRLTLRSALARLETEGLIRSRQGAPTRVLDYRHHAGVDIVEYLARTASEGGVIPLELHRDLMELRRVVAVEMLGLVTERAGTDELDAVAAAHRAMAAVKSDPEAFMKADLAFARTLVRASGNLAVELLYNTILRLIESSEALRPAFFVNAQATLDTYGAILDLMRRGDAAEVRRVTRKALEALDRLTLDRIAAGGSRRTSGSDGGEKKR